MSRPCALLLLAACYGGATIDVTTGEPPVDVPGDVAEPPPPAMPTQAGSGGALPCDVGQLLAARCQSCHSSPPKGAPMALVTKEDLARPANSDPSRSVAALSLERMKDAARPMPPSGLPG